MHKLFIRQSITKGAGVCLRNKLKLVVVAFRKTHRVSGIERFFSFAADSGSLIISKPKFRSIGSPSSIILVNRKKEKRLACRWLSHLFNKFVGKASSEHFSKEILLCSQKNRASSLYKKEVYKSLTSGKLCLQLYKKLTGSKS